MARVVERDGHRAGVIGMWFRSLRKETLYKKVKDRISLFRIGVACGVGLCDRDVKQGESAEHGPFVPAYIQY